MSKLPDHDWNPPKVSGEESGPDCRACGDTAEDEKGNPCQECCSHDEHDHGICLDCGLDRSDDLAAQAEFQAECARDRRECP